MNHDLIGSFRYLETAAILPDRRDALLRRVSPAAKDLHGVACHLRGRGGNIALHHGHSQSVVLSPVEFPGRLVDKVAHVSKLHLHIGQHLLNLLEGGDRGSEGTARLRPPNGILHGGLSLTQRRGAYENTTEFEEFEQLGKPLGIAAKTIGRIKDHVVEKNARKRKHGLADFILGHHANPFQIAGNKPQRKRRLAAFSRGFFVNRRDKQRGAYSPLFTKDFTPLSTNASSRNETAVFMPMVSDPALGSETARANASLPVFWYSSRIGAVCPALANASRICS